ncbi:dTDP-glucose 4,6-dehydratase [Agrobacterium vitis]|nr:dTDP-glucose 4,6-dehydratase [Agrobacterium vitis]MBE1436629.1 dTDP-glucose 4,6-dehydratase [Agrobacterium vitis]
MPGRSTLVTGASGFIGSHLVTQLLESGDRVRAYVRYNGRGTAGHLDLLPPHLRREVDIVFGDVTDPWSVREAMRGCGTIFHLAALISIPYSYIAPHSFFETNTMGTLHVLEAARQQGVDRFVHVSTSECYGTAQQVPIPESHPIIGQSPYSASKIGADQAATSYHRAFGVPLVTVRPFNTYGPRQSMRAIIPSIIVQALTTGKVRIGALTPTRDLTFVTDTAQGMIAASGASDDALGKTFNLGNGKEIAIGALAKRLLALLAEEGCTAELEHDPERLRPERSEVERLCADAGQAAAMLGWRPEVSLDEGLRRTISFVRANLATFHPERLLP